MSPEQFEGNPDEINAASDIYSLGVVLYELLTGTLPFRGSMLQIMAQILKEEPRPPSSLRPDIDSRLDRICLKMMHRDAGQRFESMNDVVSILTKFLKSGSENQAAPPPAPVEDTEEEVEAYPDEYRPSRARSRTTRHRSRRSSKKKRRAAAGGLPLKPVLAAAGVLVVLVVAWASGLFTGDDGNSDESEQMASAGSSAGASAESGETSSADSQGRAGESTRKNEAGENPAVAVASSGSNEAIGDKAERVNPSDSSASEKNSAPLVAPAGAGLVVCERLTTSGAPTGLHPDAAAFSSEVTEQNGFQIRLPGWKAWSANEWQFDFRHSGTRGRGFYLIQPVRFGHITVLLKRDNCGVYCFTQWPEVRPAPHPSVKHSGFDQFFPLEEDRIYKVSSRIDELGNYQFSIDGKPVLKAQFPLSRDMADGQAVASTARQVRPLIFRPQSRYRGERLIMKWPPGSGGLVIDEAVDGVNEASQIRVTQTAPSEAHPVSGKVNDGLVLWYRFDEEPAVDSSESSHVATATGNPRLAEGVVNGSVELDGESEFQIQDAGDFDWNEPFTICAWFLPATVDWRANAFFVARMKDGEFPGYSFGLRRATLSTSLVHGGTSKIGYYAGRKSQMDYSKERLVAPLFWTHAALTYDGTGSTRSGQLYLDGRSTNLVVQAGQRLSDSIRNAGPLTVGTRFKGRLDDLRIYNRRLSSEEISFLAAPDR